MYDLFGSTLSCWKARVTSSVTAGVFLLLTVISGIVNAATALAIATAPKGSSPPWYAPLSNPLLTLCLLVAGLVWIGASVFFALVQAWGDLRAAANVAVAKHADALDQIKTKDHEVDERNARLATLHRELDQERQKNTPHLVAEIAAQLLWGSDADRGVTLTMTMTVKNVPPSAPSAAYKYGVLVEKDGKQYRYRFEKIPNEFSISGPLPDGRTWHDLILGTDSLIEKTTEPIPTGGLKTGWLIAIFSDFKTREALHGAKVTIEFYDIRGERGTLEFTADMEHFSPTIPIAAGVSWSYREDPPKPQIT